MYCLPSLTAIPIPRNFVAALIARAYAEIMTEITDDLYRGWDEFNADAFVNAWVSF